MSWASYHTKDMREKYLFRFMKREHLFQFLNDGNIWFARADKFGDKMECVRIRDLQTAKPDFEELEKRKRKFYISCWHTANKESLALWDTYVDTSDNRRAFAIRFDRAILVSLMREAKIRNDQFYYKTKWTHGKVQYKDLLTASQEKLNSYAMKHPAFRKEGAFQYESEYRFVLQFEKENIADGFAYNIGDARKIAFDILINPLLEKKLYLQLKSQLVERGFEKNFKPSLLAKWLKPEFW